MPRLGIAGKDHDDDVALSIVVMNRTHAHQRCGAADQGRSRQNEQRRNPAPGSQDRSLTTTARRWSAVTTHTVLHNLIFGCLLVFLIQWIFLGDLRSAIIVGANIPFALFFAIIVLVMRGEDANLLSVGAVDFGIIVDSAVILVENIFRNFQSRGRKTAASCRTSQKGHWGTDPASPSRPSTVNTWTDRLRLILISALQVDKAIFFSATITVAAFVPLFTMQGVEGQIFGPMARTYGYALAGALDRDLHGDAGSGIVPAARARQRDRDRRGTDAAGDLFACPAAGRSPTARPLSRSGMAFLAGTALLATRLGSEFLPALEEGNFWIRASMPPSMGLDAGTEADCARCAKSC